MYPASSESGQSQHLDLFESDACTFLERERVNV